MKRKILAIGFVISLVFSYCLSGLQRAAGTGRRKCDDRL